MLVDQDGVALDGPDEKMEGEGKVIPKVDFLMVVTLQERAPGSKRG